MKLRWFGQSCFLLTSQAGTRVLMDPFDGRLGYKIPKIKVDLVTNSHSHFDHNYLGAIQGNFRRLSETGKYTHEDISILGIPTYHDQRQGKERGGNIIYRFTVDGLRVCHCGDLGHVLTPEQVEMIGAVDLLLIPVGGRFTIDALEAAEVCKQLKAVVTVPMHYRTRALGLIGLLFARADKFVSTMGATAQERRELSIDSTTLSKSAGVILMAYE